MEVETEVQNDKRYKVQSEHEYNAPSLFALKQIASEVDDYRNNREQETIRSASKTNIVSRDDRICRYFKDNADINRKDMSGPAQYETETVNDYAQKIKLDQRPNACDPEDQQKTEMNETHSSDSKRERIAAKEMQDLIDHRHFLVLCLFFVSRSFHSVRVL